jgi:hypothetical protein
MPHIHYGLIFEPDQLSPALPGDLGFEAFRQFPGGDPSGYQWPSEPGLISDGDSFLQWGESQAEDGRNEGPVDSTLHVIRKYDGPVFRRTEHNYDSAERRALIDQIEKDRFTLGGLRYVRLADYVIVTDGDDWEWGPGGEPTRPIIWTLEGALS